MCSSTLFIKESKNNIIIQIDNLNKNDYNK